MTHCAHSVFAPRPANFAPRSWLLAEQQAEYVSMFGAFGGFSLFRSLQTAVGMSVMYRWTTLASGVTRDGSTVLEKYCGASRTLTELVMLDMAEDYGITMYILQTGAGSVLSHLSHFRTHVPDSWRDFFGQRRRWYAGMIVGQFNLLFVRSPFWSRRYGRCAFWLLLVYSYVFTFVLSLASVAYTVARSSLTIVIS